MLGGAALDGSREVQPHDLQDEDEEGFQQTLLLHFIPIKTSAAFPLMRQIPVNLGDFISLLLSPQMSPRSD